MQVVITAVGPDNVGLADPIIHQITGAGGNIAEIQMYDHDEEALFAMFLRLELPEERLDATRDAMRDIGNRTGLGIRLWTPPTAKRKPRLAICTTYRPEPALALLRAIRDRHVRAEVPLMVGNRPNCRGLAEQFGCDWHLVGDGNGRPSDERMIELFDEYQVDFVILARYMRVLPPSTCWKYAGGRIINLHHGLLPGFPGMRPYHDAHRNRMLTYGATCHFIVPELDAGNQIICQNSFSVRPGQPLDEIIRLGQEDNEPGCLVEGVRRVVDREVQLHFHKVIARSDRSDI
ncbi:MAG: formyltetrahydrofolate deformylase [Planctomycetales bacterium]|nr:formyltetrahydrofolate deformylase [Planctomycetales bacterium]